MTPKARHVNQILETMLNNISYVGPPAYPIFSCVTIGELRTMPAFYWSNYFSIITFNKYENGKKRTYGHPRLRSWFFW